MSAKFHPEQRVLWKPGKCEGTVISFLGAYQSKENRAQLGDGDTAGAPYYLVEFKLPGLDKADRHGCWESDLEEVK